MLPVQSIIRNTSIRILVCINIARNTMQGYLYKPKPTPTGTILRSIWLEPSRLELNEYLDEYSYTLPTDTGKALLSYSINNLWQYGT